MEVSGADVFAKVLRWQGPSSIVLGEHSPLFLPEPNLHALRPVEVTARIASLSRDDAGFTLTPALAGDVFFINGRRAPGLLAHGDVIDFKPALGPVTTWRARLRDEPLPEGLGPLWAPFQCGAFSFTEERGRWAGVLRGGTHSLALDSLSWLRRLLQSPLTRRFASLVLHVVQLDQTIPWSDFHTRLLGLARTAPFPIELRGREPLLKLEDVVEREWVRATEHGWIVSGTMTRPVHVSGAPEQLTGWMTVAPGDEVEVPDSTAALQRLPGEPALFEVRSTPRPAATPHAQFPAERWSLQPLSWEHGLWVLTMNGDVWRWLERDGALFEVGRDGAVAESPTPWFSMLRNVRERWQHTLSNFRLLPRHSAFLAGERLVPFQRPSREMVSVFADTLEAEGDCAGPLLQAVASDLGGEQALTTLLWPYAQVPGVRARPVFAGEHCCGFIERATVEPWLNFELDLPIMLTHPMLQRLERLDLVDGSDSRSAEWIGRAEISSLVRAVTNEALATKVFVRGVSLRP